jgi:hypothetical protein
MSCSDNSVPAKRVSIVEPIPARIQFAPNNRLMVRTSVCSELPAKAKVSVTAGSRLVAGAAGISHHHR